MTETPRMAHVKAADSALQTQTLAVHGTTSASQEVAPLPWVGRTFSPEPLIGRRRRAAQVSRLKPEATRCRRSAAISIGAQRTGNPSYKGNRAAFKCPAYFGRSVRLPPALLARGYHPDPPASRFTEKLACPRWRRIATVRRIRAGKGQGGMRMRAQQHLARWQTIGVAHILVVACVGSIGCQANGPLGSWWNGAPSRVPPPATSSYGTATPYYGPTQPAPGAAPALPPIATQPPTTPPPPAVPATGARPSLTTGASLPAAAGYGSANVPEADSRFGSVRPSSAIWGNPSASNLPSVPPTYLSTPARVDTLIQPASAQQPASGSPATLVPATGLRWGVR